MRVFNSIEHYRLNISRAVFVAGKNPFKYLKAFNAALFLSGNKEDVKEAIEHDLPAGYVNISEYEDDETDPGLRMAFDFDAVLADDSSERVYQEKGIDKYKEYELEHGNIPMSKGPLYDFIIRISKIQKAELEKEKQD